jgi:hypothetical protein
MDSVPAVGGVVGWHASVRVAVSGKVRERGMGHLHEHQAVREGTDVQLAEQHRLGGANLCGHNRSIPES